MTKTTEQLCMSIKPGFNVTVLSGVLHLFLLYAALLLHTTNNTLQEERAKQYQQLDEVPHSQTETQA